MSHICGAIRHSRLSSPSRPKYIDQPSDLIVEYEANTYGTGWEASVGVCMDQSVYGLRRNAFTRREKKSIISGVGGCVCVEETMFAKAILERERERAEPLDRKNME